MSFIETEPLPVSKVFCFVRHPIEGVAAYAADVFSTGYEVYLIGEVSIQTVSAHASRDFLPDQRRHR